MRRWYQRHGYANDALARPGESRPTMQEIGGWLGWPILVFWLLGTAALVGEALSRDDPDRSRLFGTQFVSALATTLLLVRNRPRRTDGSWWVIAVLGLFTTDTVLTRAAPTSWPIPWVKLSILGLALAAAAGVGHARYRRVERRLRALREAR